MFSWLEIPIFRTCFESISIPMRTPATSGADAKAFCRNCLVPCSSFIKSATVNFTSTGRENARNQRQSLQQIAGTDWSGHQKLASRVTFFSVCALCFVLGGDQWCNHFCRGCGLIRELRMFGATQAPHWLSAVAYLKRFQQNFASVFSPGRLRSRSFSAVAKTLTPFMKGRLSCIMSSMRGI